jgi:AcrR family transcriptional regulator
LAEPGLTARAEQTRSAIVEAALRLFRERGYDAATMRAIASAAGVSTGNAYYYFSSKDDLIQEFYLRSHAEHAAACRDLLDRNDEFAVRLRGTVRSLIDVLNPYHAFAATFYKSAAGSSARIDRELRAELPELLWLYSLGIVLFWVYDTSPGRARTYRLIDATVPLVERLIALARVPVLRGTTRELVALIQELRG